MEFEEDVARDFIDSVPSSLGVDPRDVGGYAGSRCEYVGSLGVRGGSGWVANALGSPNPMPSSWTDGAALVSGLSPTSIASYALS